VAQLQDFKLFVEDGHQAAQLFQHRVELQQVLLVFQVDADIRCQRVDELQRVVDVQRGVDQLAGDARHKVCHAPKLLDHVPHQGFDFDRLFDGLGRSRDARAQIGLCHGVFVDLDPRQTLHQQPDRPIRRAKQAVDLSQRPVAIDLVGAGRLQVRIA